MECQWKAITSNKYENNKNTHDSYADFLTSYGI